MRRTKAVGACMAVTAVMCAFSAPAMAGVFRVEPSGQPLISGSETGAAVVHCQEAAEVGLGVELRGGDAPGAIVRTPHGIKITGPEANLACEHVAAALGL